MTHDPSRPPESDDDIPPEWRCGSTDVPSKLINLKKMAAAEQGREMFFIPAVSDSLPPDIFDAIALVCGTFPDAKLVKASTKPESKTTEV